MTSFEQVIDIFGDYLALDTEMEVCKSWYGYIRVEFHGTGELPGYCSGMVCRTPKELFDLLLSDYESYLDYSDFRVIPINCVYGKLPGLYTQIYRNNF